MDEPLGTNFSEIKNLGTTTKPRDRNKDDDLKLELDQIVTTLQLGGGGAKLYQLTRQEKFDDAKVETKLRALRPGDLERHELFKSVFWMFYLPPKGASDQVLDDIIAEALK